MADLHSLLKKDATFLKGAALVDKVIGKAAVLAMLSGVKETYAEAINLSALVLLRETRVDADFRIIVPFIRNRNGDDWCPLEMACYKEKSVNDILSKIESFLADIPARKTA